MKGKENDQEREIKKGRERNDEGREGKVERSKGGKKKPKIKVK